MIDGYSLHQESGGVFAYKTAAAPSNQQLPMETTEKFPINFPKPPEKTYSGTYYMNTNYENPPPYQEVSPASSSNRIGKR